MVPEFGIDTVHTVTQKVCDAMKESLRSFVGRYYAAGSYPKIIKRSEAELIINNGLKLVIIHQNTNNEDKWFSAEKGRIAAEGAASCAAAIGQPAGTAIYFAVDYDCLESGYQNCVLPHFKAIQEYFKAQSLGYSIGVYGSGYVCRKLKEDIGLTYTWLAAAKDWKESNTYKDYNLWQMETDQTLGGIEVDFDRSTAERDYGAITYLV